MLFFISINYPIMHAKGLYPIANVFGTMADLFVANGKLSPKNEQMFRDIAEKMGIADRKIKVRNSGLLLRFLRYQGVFSYQRLNRAYLNDNFLNELSDSEKKFWIATAAAYHAQHIGVKDFLGSFGIFNILAIFLSFIAPQSMGNNLINKLQRILVRYAIEGYEIPLIKELPIIGKIISSRLPNFSLPHLLYGQYIQNLKKKADRKAIFYAEIDSQEAAKAITASYYPEKKQWPAYAHIQDSIIKVIEPFATLPFVRHHFSYLMSISDRIKNIQKVD